MGVARIRLSHMSVEARLIISGMSVGPMNTAFVKDFTLEKSANAKHGLKLMTSRWSENGGNSKSVGQHR